MNILDRKNSLRIRFRLFGYSIEEINYNLWNQLNTRFVKDCEQIILDYKTRVFYCDYLVTCLTFDFMLGSYQIDHGYSIKTWVHFEF